MRMDIAVFADLHGIPSRFEKIRRIIDGGIKIILLAGDIEE